MRTQQRMKETIESIKRVAEGGIAVGLANIEVATGIIYDKDGLVFDDWTLELSGFPDCVDATNCMFGGVHRTIHYQRRCASSSYEPDDYCYIG